MLCLAGVWCCADGWNLGQHRLPGGKHNVYDHSVRIPMVMVRCPPSPPCSFSCLLTLVARGFCDCAQRGPGIAPGSTFSYPASNVDVAPTLLGLAGVDELSAQMDGKPHNDSF